MPDLTRAALIDAAADAMDDVHDQGVTFGQFAAAAVDAVLRLHPIQMTPANIYAGMSALHDAYPRGYGHVRISCHIHQEGVIAGLFSPDGLGGSEIRISANDWETALQRLEEGIADWEKSSADRIVERLTASLLAGGIMDGAPEELAFYGGRARELAKERARALLGEEGS